MSQGALFVLSGVEAGTKPNLAKLTLARKLGATVLEVGCSIPLAHPMISFFHVVPRSDSKRLGRTRPGRFPTGSFRAPYP